MYFLENPVVSIGLSWYIHIHGMANIKLFSTKLAMFGQSRKETKYLRKYAFTLAIET